MTNSKKNKNSFMFQLSQANNIEMNFAYFNVPFGQIHLPVTCVNNSYF